MASKTRILNQKINGHDHTVVWRGQHMQNLEPRGSSTPSSSCTIMSLFKYFTHIETDPNRPISTQMDKSVITEVNKQLRDVQQKKGNPKKRGAYSHRSATEKAAIGRYACENGVAATL